MQYKYYICDEFTKKRFGGNPLVVLPEAEGLTDKQMKQIAREFNFSESSFVFPPENGEHKIEHLGRNETNYFMYQWAGPVSS